MSLSPQPLADHPVEVASGPLDAELMQRVGAGDRGALAILYERHSGPVYSLARYMVSDVAVAEEVLQDAFVRLWRHAGRFEDGRASVRTWLLTITRNLSLDRLRALKRQPAPAPMPLEDPADPAAVTKGLLADERRHVRQAVDGLEPDTRRCLELAYFEGLTQSEIAHKLQHPLGTVKSRIRRGLLQLRETLSFYER